MVYKHRPQVFAIFAFVCLVKTCQIVFVERFQKYFTHLQCLLWWNLVSILPTHSFLLFFALEMKANGKRKSEQYKGKTTFRSLFVFLCDFCSRLWVNAKQSKAKHISQLFVIIVVVFPLVCCWPHFADDAIRNMPHWVSNSIFRSEGIMRAQTKRERKQINFPSLEVSVLSINRKCNQIIL